jgi:hypothetical protein
MTDRLEHGTLGPKTAAPSTAFCIYCALAAAGRTCLLNMEALHLLAPVRPVANGWYLGEDLESFP